jgi:hypothetical protein
MVGSALAGIGSESAGQAQEDRALRKGAVVVDRASGQGDELADYNSANRVISSALEDAEQYLPTA